MSEEIDVRMVTGYVPVAREVLDDALPPWDELMRQMEENERAFRALPPEEQARVLREREIARLREEAEAALETLARTVDRLRALDPAAAQAVADSARHVNGA